MEDGQEHHHKVYEVKDNVYHVDFGYEGEEGLYEDDGSYDEGEYNEEELYALSIVDEIESLYGGFQTTWYKSKTFMLILTILNISFSAMVFIGLFLFSLFV